MLSSRWADCAKLTDAESALVGQGVILLMGHVLFPVHMPPCDRALRQCSTCIWIQHRLRQVVPLGGERWYARIDPSPESWVYVPPRKTMPASCRSSPFCRSAFLTHCDPKASGSGAGIKHNYVQRKKQSCPSRWCPECTCRRSSCSSLQRGRGGGWKPWIID